MTLKLRVIEDGAGRFAIQQKGLSGWMDPMQGDYFTSEKFAVYAMEQRLENRRRAEQERQVKRVILEGEA